MNLIPRDEWSCEVKRAVRKIEYRASIMALACAESDIIVCGDDDATYVLGNPLLHKSEILDEITEEPTGEFLKTYNITVEYAYGLHCINAVITDKERTFTFEAPTPRVIILQPSLCIKLKGGRVVSDAALCCAM